MIYLIILEKHILPHLNYYLYLYIICLKYYLEYKISHCNITWGLKHPTVQLVIQPKPLVLEDLKLFN